MLTTTLRFLIRRWIPISISVLALLALFSFADLQAFHGLADRARWDQVPVIIFVIGMIVIAFAWRWRTLLIELITMLRSLQVVALGLGGNQIFPLRGGDALRVVLSSRGHAAPSFHAGVSAIAIEKVFDLVAVAAFGLASAATVAATGHDGINVVGIAVLLLALAAATLLIARSAFAIEVMRFMVRLLRLPPRTYRHLSRPLHHLRQSTTPSRVAILLGQTAFIWLVLYVLAYLSIAQLVGMDLTIPEAMVLLFAGALGIAIPAAPSGVGTYHAAVVSAFALLGKPASEGLVLAVAIHGVFFVVLCSIGGLALVFTSGRRALLQLRRQST